MSRFLDAGAWIVLVAAVATLLFVIVERHRAAGNCIIQDWGRVGFVDPDGHRYSARASLRYCDVRPDADAGYTYEIVTVTPTP